jgi:hypothetical protein
MNPITYTKRNNNKYIIRQSVGIVSNELGGGVEKSDSLPALFQMNWAPGT